MRIEIERITGRKVRESAAEIETRNRSVVHVFTTGAMVQVYLLTPQSDSDQPTTAANDQTNEGGITDSIPEK